MSDDAVAYSYVNVGLDAVPTRAGVAYSMWNTGTGGARSFVGRVVGFAGLPRLGFAISHLNIGVVFDAALGLPGIAYSAWNQLEQVSGASRTLEGGVTPRLLEDGTTQRTLE